LKYFDEKIGSCLIKISVDTLSRARSRLCERERMIYINN